MLRAVYKSLFGERVFSGPFRGLHYVPRSIGSVHDAKLLGTYERELWPQVEQLIASAPDVIVNLGAGEGYYAVGLAARLPATRVIAFETDPRGQELIRRFARLNQVASQVEIRGHATPDGLALALAGAQHPAVVIDVEGAEGELLDTARVAGLARSRILVEVHDFIAPLGGLLLARFAPTHRHVEIWSHARGPRDIPGWARLFALTPWRNRIVRAMDERRPERMRWLWFEPLGP